jgi:hypothetical protein
MSFHHIVLKLSIRRLLDLEDEAPYREHLGLGSRFECQAPRLPCSRTADGGGEVRLGVEEMWGVAPGENNGCRHGWPKKYQVHLLLRMLGNDDDLKLYLNCGTSSGLYNTTRLVLRI